MASVAMAESLQTNIEIMTRRLELEKRRLHRVEQELAAAHRAYEQKLASHNLKKQQISRPQSAIRKPPTSSIEDSSSQPLSETSRPKSGRGPRPQSTSPNLNASIQSMISSGTPPPAPSPGGAGGLSTSLDRSGGLGTGSGTATGSGPAAGGSGGGSSRRGGHPYMSVAEYIKNPSGPGFAKELLKPETGGWKTVLNRLDSAVKKLDVVRHDNSQLQEGIDKMRRQRLQLNSIFDRLKAEIKHRTAQLADVNEETNTGVVMQGEMVQRIQVMNKQRETDRARFKEQVVKIRQDLKDYDFEKKEVEVKLKRAQDGVQTKRRLIMPPEESDFSETAMMRRIMKTAFLNCIQRRHIKQHEKTIAVFNQAFATIKQSTGISDIEEIVKIFIHLESKNYSLLTYVNHMNREIEALENIRMKRREAEAHKRERERTQEQTKEETVGATQKVLEGKASAVSTSREACARHRNVLNELRPILQGVCSRIQEELENLKKAAGPFHSDFLPRPPVEMQDEDIAQCLEWIEKAMGRFRDLMKGSDRDHIFPCTARSRVVNLKEKRFNGPNHPLVNKNELPFCMVADDVPAQKKSNITAAQKADILDEEAEEEDFGDRPLLFKDIKQRAEKAIARRKKGRRQHPGDVLGPGGGGHFGGTGELHQSGRQLDFFDEDGERLGGRGNEEEGDRSASATGGSDMAEEGRRHAGMTEATGADVSEEEVAATFLRRYRMSREDLQLMADRLNIQLPNLCFLKQEFDQFDLDQSGYMDAGELKSLLRKLGEDLSEDDLNAAFQDLDADGSGEIEFFEFVEWFTSPSADEELS